MWDATMPVEECIEIQVLGHQKICEGSSVSHQAWGNFVSKDSKAGEECQS